MKKYILVSILCFTFFISVYSMKGISIKSNPKRALLYNSLGMQHYNKKNYRKALSSFLTAIKYDNSYYWAQFNAACVYSLLGENQLALKRLKASVCLNNWMRMDAFEDNDFRNIKNTTRFKSLKNLQEAHFNNVICNKWRAYDGYTQTPFAYLVLKKDGTFLLYSWKIGNIGKTIKGKFIRHKNALVFKHIKGETVRVTIKKRSLALIMKLKVPGNNKPHTFLLHRRYSTSEIEIIKIWAKIHSPAAGSQLHKQETTRTPEGHEMPSNSQIVFGYFGEYIYQHNPYFTIAGFYKHKNGTDYVLDKPTSIVGFMPGSHFEPNDWGKITKHLLP